MTLRHLAVFVGVICWGVRKLELCLSERSEESHFSGYFCNCQAKAEILRRFAAQSDTRKSILHTHPKNLLARLLAGLCRMTKHPMALKSRPTH
jgi:hypothetical protein